MKSSSNTYLSNLDHLRAFAAFMVFIYHLLHYSAACPQSYCNHPYHLHWPFFSLLEQGYSGIALFMCISGYIFTYLTDGRRLHLGKFWFNRIVRLFPLIIFWGLSESTGMIEQLFISSDVDKGLLLQQIVDKILHPQGSWTIYIELQYYLSLPLILFGIRRFGPKILLWVLLVLIASRAIAWYCTGSVQVMAYWTIGGRADQFLLGTAAYYLEKRLIAHPYKKRILYSLGAAGTVGILAFFHYIHLQGGFYKMGGSPSHDMIWIWFTDVEGICYSLIIIAYMQLRIPSLLNRALSACGKWSYSIYLGHLQITPFFVVLAAARFGVVENFYSRLAIDTLFIFPQVVLFSALTYTMIEKPFLKLRKNYLIENKAAL